MFGKLSPVFKLVGLAAALVTTAPAYAADIFTLTPSNDPLIVSDGVSDTNKVKILRTPDGTLFAVYGLGQGTEKSAFGPQSRETRKPSDLVIQSSKDDGVTWAEPINIDNTADLSSAKGIIDETGFPPLFPAEDPNEGSVDLDSDPRAVDYPGESYITEQMTSGVRSAKQDGAQTAQAGVVVLWQEDPLGLQLGDGEGPGSGGSGSNTTGGTDAWYMYLDTDNNNAVKFTTEQWSAPVRITKNTQKNDAELQGPTRSSHGPGLYDNGSAGLSRANLRLVGRRAIIAWEETKSTMGLESGKYVRYLTWPEFTAPPVGRQRLHHQQARRERPPSAHPDPAAFSRCHGHCIHLQAG